MIKLNSAKYGMIKINDGLFALRYRLHFNHVSYFRSMVILYAWISYD